MGWVSLFDPADIKSLLRLPNEAEPLAILCLGPVKAFYPAPMLEQEGWAQRQGLPSVLMENYWCDDSE